MYEIDEYVQDIHWRLTNAFDYAYWKYGNTQADNEFSLKTLDKEHTSFTGPVDTVSYASKIWSCVRGHQNQPPTEDGIYWKETVGGSGNLWSSGPIYVGEETESKAIAEFHLNQWANRHRVVDFTTNDLSYLRFQIADVIEFTNVPYSLIGMDIKGFNGATNYTSSVNGQTCYASFIITDITKSNKDVKIKAMQLHKLDDYLIERVN